jgi:hypothetical protein
MEDRFSNLFNEKIVQIFKIIYLFIILLGYQLNILNNLI